MKTQEDKLISWKTVFVSIVILLVAIVIAGGVAKYVFNVSSIWMKKIESIIPYPVAFVGYSDVITIKELNENVRAVRQFYEVQDFSVVGLRVDFSTADGKKRLKIKEKEILNRMIEDKVVMLLVEKEGVKISDKMISQILNRKLEEYGTEQEVKENLQRLYGWTIEEFKEKIVKNDIYRQELEKIFEKNNVSSKKEARKKIEKAFQELSEGESFSQVVRRYSEGLSAQNEGELGWFRKDQLMPEIADSVMNLSERQRSGILESKLGFHIIEMNKKKVEQGVDLVNIKQIFVSQKTFADWLNEEMKKISIILLLPDFFWNKSISEVDFKNEQLKVFEKKIQEEFQGDASLMF